MIFRKNLSLMLSLALAMTSCGNQAEDAGSSGGVSEEDQASEISALASSNIILRSKINLGGRNLALGVGDHDLSRNSAWNDQVRSLVLPENLTVTLFENSGFSGASVQITQTSKDLGNFKDKVSSLQVRLVTAPVPDPSTGPAPVPAPSPTPTPTPTPSPLPGVPNPILTEKVLQTTSAQSLNPLKGFVPFQGSYSGFPHSMEFFYLPLSAVFKGVDTYDFAPLNAALNDISSRKHQVVFRFYLDYPGQAHGVPQFLVNAGVRLINYSEFGGGQMPDYKSPLLIDALNAFIKELGLRYDGDPRIAFIFTGLIGHWGEWHTYPQDSLMATVADQTKIIEAFDLAFNKTKVLTRMPAPYLRGHDIGLHDDSFAYETLPTQSWHFVSMTQSAGLTDVWKSSPIGGELRPEIQQTIWDAIPPADSESYSESVKQTHASWMLAHQLFGSLSANRKAAAILGAAALGYDFAITKALVTKSGTQWSLAVKIENRGVAPFYYKWPVEIGIGTSPTAVNSIIATNFDPSSIAAGATVEMQSILPLTNLDSRSLFIRIRNPLANAVPLRFSNQEQDKAVTGWLSLGDF
jgi:hypothetical protein